MALTITQHPTRQFSDGATSQRIFFDLHAFEIRLISLLPGAWEDEIRCELFQAPLANHPSYKALSYVWGSARVSRPILLNEIRYHVTVNLESALRRIRRTSESLTLWVDALCINQSDTAERTNQVKLMRNIFSSTEEVVVYLGEVASYHVNDHEQTARAAKTETVFFYDQRDHELLGRFYESCKSNSFGSSGAADNLGFELDVFCLVRSLAESSSFVSKPPFDNASRSRIPSRYLEKLFEALRQLMRSRWWNRIWTIQEIVVPKRVKVIYGSLIAPWNMFAKAAFTYAQMYHSSLISTYPKEFTKVLSLFARTVGDIEDLRSLWHRGTRQDLLQLLRQFSGRGATDDRDKIYALLGLHKGAEIIADYALTTKAVFVETARVIVKTSQSLELLMGDLGRKNRLDIPSWVPDWTAMYDDIDRRRAENSKLYRSGPEAPGQINNDARLSLTAILSRLARGLNLYYHLFLLKNEGETVNPLEVSFESPVLTHLETQNVDVVCGFSIGRIAAVGLIDFSGEELASTIQGWFRTAVEAFLPASLDDEFSTPELSNIYKTKEEVIHAFQRTLCGDMILERSDGRASEYRRISEADQPALDAWLFGLPDSPLRDHKFFVGKFNPATTIDPEQIECIDAAIKLATYRRRFFVTKTGYMGLGPLTTFYNYQVILLHGSQTPFILRLNDSLESTASKEYIMIGDCYVDRAMDDDAKAVLASSELNWPIVSAKLEELQVIEGVINQGKDDYSRIADDFWQIRDRLEQAVMLLAREAREKIEYQLI